MRFRKRLSAVFLAAMLLTSAQLPGGVSYAAETASGLETVALTAEGTAAASVTQLSDDTEMGRTRSNDGIVTDGAGQKKEEDVTAEDNSQPGGGEQAGEDGQPGESTQPGEDSTGGDDQIGEDNPDSGDQTGDESQPDSEDNPEEDPGAEQVSGNDLEVSKADGEEAIVLYSAAYDGSAEDYIYQQLLKREEYIDLYGAGFHYVMDNPTRRLTEKHPELYHVNVLYSLLNENAVVRDDNGYIKALREEYYNDREEAKFRAAVEEALACVDNGMSDLEKVVALHDYLASHTKYDYETEAKIEYNIEHGINEEFVASTAYSALVNRFSVCGGVCVRLSVSFDAGGG